MTAVCDGNRNTDNIIENLLIFCTVELNWGMSLETLDIYADEGENNNRYTSFLIKQQQQNFDIVC